VEAKRPYFNKNSRMKHYDIIFDSTIEQNRVAFYKYSNIASSTNDQKYTVTKGTQHRLDLISVKFYGTAAYDWFIAEYNNIEDPIRDIKPGLKLIIPDRSRLGGV